MSRATRTSLLEQVQGLLERTYDMERRVREPGAFIIGDHGIRALFDPQEVDRPSSDPEGQGARTLVRQTEQGVRVSVYLPNAMIERLERHPPTRGLDHRNVDAFATLVEELDHLLCIADGAAVGRPLSLFELELHANVSKALVLGRFLAGRRGKLDPERRAWLRYHLFFKGEYADADAAVRGRYRDAARLALRLLDGLPRLAPPERLRVLRSFHRQGAAEKVRLIEALRN